MSRDKNNRIDRTEVEAGKKLNDLFFFDELDGETEQLILREAKRKSTLRIALVSVVVVALLLTTGVLLKVQLTPFLMSKEIAEVESYFEHTGANLHTGQWMQSNRLWGSDAYAARYKLVEGIPVFQGEIRIPGDDFRVIPGLRRDTSEDWLINQYEPEYSLYGEKKMQFLQPGISYEREIMEFDRIANLRDDEAAELGISFDRLYSLEEVRKLLPEGVTPVWCWVDTLGADMQGALVDGRGLVKGEEDAFGFALIDDQGNVKADPTFDFTTASGEKIDEGSPRLAGAVVTGNRESLEQLEGAKFLKAASMGAVVTLR